MINDDTMRMDNALNDVRTERMRQETLRESGKFLWTCAALHVSLDRKNSVLAEEVGEVAKEVVDIGIVDDKYKKESLEFPWHRKRILLIRLRKELVQVAAVCVAWCEAIDLQVQSMDLDPEVAK
jgi:hypothetical protein